MEFAGLIQKNPDPPGVDRSAWIALVAAREDLVLPQARVAVNPFTGKPVTIPPLQDSASVFVDGQCVAWFHWSQNEENVISVWGDLARVRPMAGEEKVASTKYRQDICVQASFGLTSGGGVGKRHECHTHRGISPAEWCIMF